MSNSIKPSHEVVKLRADVRSGELTLAMFAADLYDVVMQTAKPVYRDPKEFFTQRQGGRAAEKTGRQSQI